MPYVYILRCRDGSLYTGAAKSVARRLGQHQAGRASRYTRARLPVELAWSRSGSALDTALMLPLGFFASIGLLTCFVVAWVMGKSPFTALLTAIGIAAGFWLVFPFALGINLPTGTLWPPLLAAVGIG